MLCLGGIPISSSKHIPDIKNVIRTEFLAMTFQCCILEKYVFPKHQDSTPPLLTLNPTECLFSCIKSYIATTSLPPPLPPTFLEQFLIDHKSASLCDLCNFPEIPAVFSNTEQCVFRIIRTR